MGDPLTPEVQDVAADPAGGGRPSALAGARLATSAAVALALADAPDAERLDYWLPRVPLAATPVEVTPEGFEVYEGTATFGDVGVPLTLGHPPRLLTAETAKPYLLGTVLAAWRDGNAPTTSSPRRSAPAPSSSAWAASRSVMTTKEHFRAGSSSSLRDGY